ncbi:MAG TPA: hypothetical protein VG370_12220 [Chloroflexota bacterium]|nr:hypothetical protein [Chloroflexota bacterium]
MGGQAGRPDREAAAPERRDRDRDRGQVGVALGVDDRDPGGAGGALERGREPLRPAADEVEPDLDDGQVGLGAQRGGDGGEPHRVGRVLADRGLVDRDAADPLHAADGRTPVGGEGRGEYGELASERGQQRRGLGADVAAHGRVDLFVKVVEPVGAQPTGERTDPAGRAGRGERAGVGVEHARARLDRAIAQPDARRQPDAGELDAGIGRAGQVVGGDDDAGVLGHNGVPPSAGRYSRTGGREAGVGVSVRARVAE